MTIKIHMITEIESGVEVYTPLGEVTNVELILGDEDEATEASNHRLSSNN